MTVDTSREAVEALIAELRKDAKRDAAHRNEHARATRFNRKTMPSWVSADVLAALLDERDRLENSLSARDVELQQDALRIRDLEADLAGARGVRDRERDRAERAEAELLHARGISEIRGAERDRLKSRADNSLRAVRDVAAKLDAVKAALNASYHEPTNRVWHEQMQRLRAILADTDEGNSDE